MKLTVNYTDYEVELTIHCYSYENSISWHASTYSPKYGEDKCYDGTGHTMEEALANLARDIVDKN